MLYPPRPEMVPMRKGARLFGLTKSWLYKLGRQGKVRIVRTAPGTLVDVLSVRQYLAQRRRSGL